MHNVHGILVNQAVFMQHILSKLNHAFMCYKSVTEAHLIFCEECSTPTWDADTKAVCRRLHVGLVDNHKYALVIDLQRSISLEVRLTKLLCDRINEINLIPGE